MENKYFKHSELACKHCGVNGVSAKALAALTALREDYGKPTILNSAYRCEEHNAKIGGSKNSYHMKGMAFDVAVPAEDKHLFLQLALKYFNGVGLHPQFYHLDVREAKIVFFYG